MSIIKIGENGTAWIDVLRYGISVDPKKLHALMDEFIACKMDGDCLSSKARALTDEIEECILKEIRQYYPHAKKVSAVINLGKYYKEFRQSIAWEVNERLEGSWVDPILPEDIPIMREFLETPPGTEKEAWKNWEKYWEKVDFKQRADDEEQHFLEACLLPKMAPED